jgi:hypothetical protein
VPAEPSGQSQPDQVILMHKFQVDQRIRMVRLTESWSGDICGQGQPGQVILVVRLRFAM